MEEAETASGHYITCPKGHKVFVVWFEEYRQFAFTCDECDEHSPRAISEHGMVEIKLVETKH